MSQYSDANIQRAQDALDYARKCLIQARKDIRKRKDQAGVMEAQAYMKGAEQRCKIAAEHLRALQEGRHR